MSYYLADANGYIEDFASIGGLKDLWRWAHDQDALVQQFFDRGYTDQPTKLAAALGNVGNGTPVINEMVAALRKTAQSAASVLIISDGTSDEPDLRAAAEVKDFQFDKTNPAAQDWASKHAAELVDGVSKTTREAIKDAVERAFEEQFDVDELSAEIENLVGDEARADTIARTETMRASNEGQQQAWDQAIDTGLLSGDEQQEWIATPDEKLCPICGGLDGQVVGLDENFNDDGDEYDGPPAHPNCRCTVGLVVP